MTIAKGEQIAILKASMIPLDSTVPREFIKHKLAKDIANSLAEQAVFVEGPTLAKAVASINIERDTQGDVVNTMTVVVISKPRLLQMRKLEVDIRDLNLPKKPIINKQDYDDMYFTCPVCKEIVGCNVMSEKYCHNCRQALDWTRVDG